MNETDRAAAPQVPRRCPDSPLIIAGGGFAAAFAAASCCGLPVLLGWLGLGSGWLAAIAWVSAPHRGLLVLTALFLLLGGTGMFLWRRRVTCCRTGISADRRGASVLLSAFLIVGAGLVVLSYLYS